MRALRRRTRACAVLGLPALLVGCLKPIGSDTPGYSPYLQQKTIASVLDDKKLAPQIDVNDGLDGATIALRTGFFDGMRVQYWDLGAVVATPQPIWRFVR